MPIVRKLVTPLSLLLMLFAASASASAAPAATATHTTLREEDITWTLPAGQCPNLPADILVQGTGQRLQQINTNVRADGSSQIVTRDQVKGSAVDSNGGAYTFVYQNHSIEDVPARGSGLPNHISMTDSFILNGKGSAAHMTVGFNWRWTYTPPEASWPPNHHFQQLSTRGEPFLCDPI